MLHFSYQLIKVIYLCYCFDNLHGVMLNTRRINHIVPPFSFIVHCLKLFDLKDTERLSQIHRGNILVELSSNDKASTPFFSNSFYFLDTITACNGGLYWDHANILSDK
jgi:hypothetical protein